MPPRGSFPLSTPLEAFILVHELVLVLTLTSDVSVYGRLKYSILFSLMKLTQFALRFEPSRSFETFRDFFRLRY